MRVVNLGDVKVITSPPTNGVTEEQTITIAGAPTGGTYRLAFQGYVTDALAPGATAAALQTALRALDSIGTAGCSVAGADGGPYTVTFAGNLGKLSVGLLELYLNSMTGDGDETVTIVEAVAGVDATLREAAQNTVALDTSTGKLYRNTSATSLQPAWTFIGTYGARETVGIHVKHSDASASKALTVPTGSIVHAGHVVCTENTAGGAQIDFGIAGVGVENLGALAPNLGNYATVLLGNYYGADQVFDNMQDVAGTGGEWDVYLEYTTFVQPAQT